MAVKPKSKPAGQAASSKAKRRARTLARSCCSPARRRGPCRLQRGRSRPGAAAIAHETVARHLPGTSVIDIRTDPGIGAIGRPVSVITVVNDNMPFLFDSVLGEITDSAGEPTLVIHPGACRCGTARTGVSEILADG